MRLYRHGQWNIPIRLPWHETIYIKMPKWIKTFGAFICNAWDWRCCCCFIFCTFLCVYVEISVHKNKVSVKWVGDTLWNRNLPKQLSGELCICLRINHCSNCKLMIIITAATAALTTLVEKNATHWKKEKKRNIYKRDGDKNDEKNCCLYAGNVLDSSQFKYIENECHVSMLNRYHIHWTQIEWNRIESMCDWSFAFSTITTL